MIHAEQGFGDTFQFVRYLPLLAERGGKVVLECPASLKSLLEGVPGVSMVVSAGDPLPHCDFHVPVMSLPLVFRTVPETIPVALPYIYPPLRALASWAEKFRDTASFRVGLVWAGRKRPDPNRTCPFHYFAPLADLPGVTFYSLQMENEMSGTEPRLSPQLVDHTGNIEDFADTAALIAHLDLVISIDTGVAHLAGALGRETWVLLPHAADWRWMLDRDDSPWYPTMRLFRQERPGDWGGVIASLRQAMAEKVSTFHVHRTAISSDLEDAYGEGLSLLRDGKVPEAERPLVRALLLNSRIPEVFNALGFLCRERGDTESARRFFLYTVALDPGYAEGHINLGNIFYGEDLLDEAASAYRRAAVAAPGDARAYQNLGVVSQSRGLLSEADAAFRKALSLQPGYPTARWNMAVLKLLEGRLREGFEEFESRFEKNDPVPLLYADRPCWDGAPFPGKTLLVHAEQGFGDTFQFVRYLSLAARQGGRVLLECQHESLRSLLSSLVRSDDLFVRGDTLPPFDMQIPLLSFPRVFGTTPEDIPSSVPYLTPPLEKIDEWKKRLAGETDFRVGLVWAGRSKPDPKRSASLGAFAPLTSVSGTVFFSLQVGAGGEQAMEPPTGMALRDYTAELTDFSATAGLLANLDLVITIDSAVAHLAGAMGKSVWVLLPYAPDWRWMLDREDSPWYPTMRLFRQHGPGEWRPVVERVVRELRILTGGR